MKLRDYQELLINLTRKALTKHRSVLVCAPTGSGKTAMSSFILAGVLDKGKTALFCVHRRQLIQQVTRELNKQNIPHGYIAAGYPQSDHAIKIAMQQTYIRRQSPEVELLITDEAHLNTKIYQQIINKNPKAKVILLSATPERLGGEPIPADVKIETVTTSELIERGELCKYKYYAPTNLDFTGVKQLGGDYSPDAIAAIAEKTAIVGDSIQHYEKFAKGEKFINFSYSVKHSIETALAFTAAGYPCAHVDAETPDAEREDCFKKLESGELLGISNVSLFVEGCDLPALVVCIIQKPTTSLMRLRQMIGRVLRNSEGKDYAIILDMVNNYRKLGLPDDKHEWRWQGYKKKKGAEKADGEPPRCTNCHTVFKAYHNICPECSHAMPPKPRTVEEIAGELALIEKKNREKIELEKKQKNIEQAQAKTLDQLIALGTKRGYKNPFIWAQHIFKARTH